MNSAFFARFRLIHGRLSVGGRSRMGKETALAHRFWSQRLPFKFHRHFPGFEADMVATPQ
jgi:hypothetical protein